LAFRLRDRIAALELLLRNQDSDRSDLLKVRRVALGLKLEERIPDAPELPFLTKLLKESARDARWALLGEPRLLRRSRLSVGGLALVEVLELGFWLRAEERAPSAAKSAEKANQEARAWLDALAMDLPRLVLPRGLTRVAPGLWSVELRAYAFQNASGASSFLFDAGLKDAKVKTGKTGASLLAEAGRGGKPGVEVPISGGDFSRELEGLGRLSLSPRALLPRWALEQPARLRRGEPAIWAAYERALHLFERSGPARELRAKLAWERARLAFLLERDPRLGRE
jgi:hypothetical protein